MLQMYVLVAVWHRWCSSHPHSLAGVTRPWFLLSPAFAAVLLLEATVLSSACRARCKAGCQALMKLLTPMRCFHAVISPRVPLTVVQAMRNQGWCNFSTSTGAAGWAGCLQTTASSFLHTSAIQSCLDTQNSQNQFYTSTRALLSFNLG